MQLLPTLAAIAAALQPPAPPPAQPMEKIVVTAVASRVEEAVDATPATVSVIPREQMERDLARDVRDALRYEPGVSVEYGATRFGLGNIAIRGLDGNRVQMLQDGIRLPDNYKVGSFSNAGRDAFETPLLSRIELLRGPGSALYGSDALAGVLSTTTLDPVDLITTGRGFGGFAEGGYAEADQSWNRTAAVAGRTKGLEALFATTRTDGHERDNMGTVGGTGATRTRPNPQDTRAEETIAKVLVPTGTRGRLRLAYDTQDRRVATDVLSLNPQSPKTTSLTADDRGSRDRWSADYVAYGLGPFETVSFIAYRQESETAQDTVEVRANTTAQCLSANGTVSCRREARFRFRQDENGATLIGRGALGRGQQWVLGAEASRIETDERRDGQQTNLNTGMVTNVVGTDIFPTRDFPRSTTDRLGAFAQDEIALARATIIPALRYDRFEMKPEPDALYTASNPGREVVGSTESRWSPKLGALVPLSAETALTLQLATGFRAPPYYDINVGLSNLPLGYVVIPNPDLKPETSRGIEAGVRGRHARFDYGVTGFVTDYHDLIVSRAPLTCPADPHCVTTAPITFQSQNVTRARIEGIEARAQARLSPEWSLRAGAAWTRGDDRTKGVPLNTVDPPKLVIGPSWTALDGNAGFDVHYTHAWAKTRVDMSSATYFAPPAYDVVDLTAFIRVTKHVRLQGGLFNLFDRKYWLWSDLRNVTNPGASVDRYTQPGRNVAVQARVDF